MSEQIEVVERGCGWPEKSGFYLTIGLSKYGIPAEDFLLDPLRPIPAQLNIKPRGLTLIEVEGVTHIVDHIGSSGYANAADWFEELKRFGFHQRVETTLPFHKLDRAKSRYFVTHSRVIPVYPDIPGWYEEFGEAENIISPTCIHSHANHDLMWQGADFSFAKWEACVSLLWADLLKGEPLQDDEWRIQKVMRKMPSFSYNGYTSNFDNETTEWAPGFFASFPISMMQGIVYEGEGMDENVARARENGWDEEIQVVSF